MSIKSITILENGPIIVTAVNTKPIALCRCGLSDNKPYCDGSHVNSFKAEPREVYQRPSCCHDNPEMPIVCGCD